MRKISIFTPSHNPRGLDEAWESIKSQSTDLDIEWVVVLNNGARYENDDPRVRIIKAPPECKKRIGALKRFGCDQCNGEILVELDHDDILLPGCLKAIHEALESGGRKFFFSPTIEKREDESDVLYGEHCGWEHAEHEGAKYNIPFPITARSLCEIFYAPNHVRAWTREAYLGAGGHDREMEVGDDHDLICRTYLSGSEFVQSTEPIYLQRMHDSNSQKKSNAAIQKQQAITRDKYLHRLVKEWCSRSRIKMYDLGGAFDCPDGYIPIDLHPNPGIQHDISKDGLPFPDSTVGCIRASDFLEHVPLDRVVFVMNEIYRVLVPGGWLLSNTPSIEGRGAFQDPTHRSWWSSNNFWYYTRSQQQKYVPEIKARFQSVRVWNGYPSDWHQQHFIYYVQADLCALKGQRQPGVCEVCNALPTPEDQDDSSEP